MKKFFAFIVLVLLGLSAQVNASVSWRYESGVYGSFEALDGVCYYDIELQNNDQNNSVFLEFATYYDGNQVDYFSGNLGPYSYTPVPFSWNNIPEGQHTIGVDIYVNGSFWDSFVFTRTWVGTPNVYLDQLYITPNQTEAGNPFDLVTSIQNTGNGAQDVVLDIFLQYGNEPEFQSGEASFTAWPNRLYASPPKTVALSYENGAFPAGDYSWRAELRNHSSSPIYLSKTFTGTPDLEFGTVTALPANPVALQAFDLSVDLYNYGTAIAEGITVEVYDGSTQIGSFYLATVDPRYYYPLTFSIPENYLLAGSHSFWFKVAGQSISSAALNMSVDGDPSLYFEPCTMTPSNPKAFEQFELVAPLLNEGGATAEGVVVDLFYDGAAIVEYDPTDIQPLSGINYTLTIPSTFVSPGTHTFIFEERGSSPLNQVSITHTYANNGTPSLTFPGGITFDPAGISEPFTSFTTETVVENNGTGWADDVIILLKVNGTTYGQYGSASDPIVLYPTGSIHLLSFPFTAAPGTYDFSYEVISAYAGADGRNTLTTKTFSITIPKPNPFACGSLAPETIYTEWGRSTGLPSEMQESHYNLYYSGSANGVLELDPSLNGGISIPFAQGSYSFTMTACYTYGGLIYESEPAGPLNSIVEAMPAPPPAPTGLSVSNPQNGDMLNLSWNAVPEAFYYRVLRNTGSPPTLQNYDTDWSTVNNSFIDANVEEGITYYYAVQSVAALYGGVSGAVSGTPTDTLAPKAPVTDEMVPGLNSVSLSWLRPEHNTDDSELTDLAGYRIEVRLNEGSGMMPGLDDPDEEGWQDIGFNGTALSTTHSFSASGGDSLAYRIFALDDSGNESDPASFGSFTVPATDPPPQPPMNLKVSERLTDSPVLGISWNPPSDNDIASYRIYRKAGDAGTFALIAEVNALQFSDRSVQFGTVYTYVAVVVDSANQPSQPSNEDSNSPAQKLLQILSPLTADPAEIHPLDGDVAQIEWLIAKLAVEQYPKGFVRLTINNKTTGESVYKDFESFPSPEQVLGIRTFNWDGYITEDKLAPAGEYDCSLTLLDDAPGIPFIFEAEELRNILLDLVPVKLTPDYNRDGVINEADVALADASEPYRVWFNLDNDDPGSEISGDDLPTCLNREDVDFLSPTVDGMRDLIDFFPMRVQVDDRLRNTSKYSYKLEDPVGFTRFNFAYSSLTADNAHAHHTDAVVASGLATAPTHRVNDEAELNDSSFLSAIQDSGEAVLLFEFSDYYHATASETNTVKTWSDDLEFAVYDNETGKKVASYALPVKGSHVEEMYRFKNIRKDGTGRLSALDEPSSYPDQLTNGKDFVFVHGYNVSAEQGDATHAEVFKRMYQSGFNGKFWGVSWYGDVPVTLGSGSHYHHSVVEAFAHAPVLKSFLSTFLTPPDLAAHSLGNGVVGIALNDADGSQPLINNYFALDAAMPLEAYGETSTESYMTYPGTIDVSEDLDLQNDYRTWSEYPEEVWASEWHELFDAADARSTLTWRNRIGDAINRVNSAYNFYSSTEEVLRASDDCLGYLQAATPGTLGLYSWQIGEWYKGLKSDSFWLDNAFPEWLAGGSSDQAGWSFVRGIGTSQHRYLKNALCYSLRPPEWVNDQLSNNATAYAESLKSDPIFKHEPGILFTASGSDFVSGLAMNYASHLDYIPSAPDQVNNRDWLLSKAFSARSRPLGSSPMSFGSGWANYNMASDNSSVNNGLMLHGWPRTTHYNGGLEWRHGDFKDVAYPYVQELYKNWVNICE